MFLFINKVDCELDSETWSHKEATKKNLRLFMLEVHSDFCEIKARKEP